MGMGKQGLRLRGWGADLNHKMCSAPTETRRPFGKNVCKMHRGKERDLFLPSTISAFRHPKFAEPQAPQGPTLYPLTLDVTFFPNLRPTMPAGCGRVC